MKISHEVPISLFEYNNEWSDYDYCLPIFMDKYPDYRQYFLDSRERDRFIIMDNSLFEGYSHTTQDLLDKIDLIKPDIFIVPDEWNDSTLTAKNAKHWIQYKMPMRTKLIAVTVSYSFRHLSNKVLESIPPERDTTTCFLFLFSFINFFSKIFI